MLKLLVIGTDVDNNLIEKVVPYQLESGHSTKIVVDLGKQVTPEACVANYGCQGCLSTMLDELSIKFLLSKMSQIRNQTERSQLWTVLAEHLKMLKVSPE